MTYCVNAAWYNLIAVRKKQVFGRCFHMSNTLKIILMLIYVISPIDLLPGPIDDVAVAACTLLSCK